LRIINPIETFPPCTFVATIGFFDGVHLGHRYLLQRLKDEAKALGKESMVISFDNHPKTILPTNYNPALLTSNSEKIQLLDDFGIDNCVLLQFDQHMANLTAYDFLKQVIVDKLGVHTLLIGYNHRFGKNREEGINEYIKYGQELGLKIIEGAPFDYNNEHISSSVIRKLIEKGDVEKAKLFLSYPYCLEGIVIAGNKIGRTIGFPTANLAICEKAKLIPGHGIYAVKVIVKGNLYWGMLNIGNRPTMDIDHKETIEVNILDFNEDIYDETISVLFLQKIRDEIKFKSIDELIAEIEKDKEFVIDLANKKFQK